MAPLCEWALLVNDHLWVCSLLPYYFPLINFIEADKAECGVAYPTSRYFPCSQQRYSSSKCRMSPMFHLAIDNQDVALLSPSQLLYLSFNSQIIMVQLYLSFNTASCLETALSLSSHIGVYWYGVDFPIERSQYMQWPSSVYAVYKNIATL